jgi:hypothetical protein
MRRIPRKIRELLERAQQITDRRNVRAGVRIIDADTPEGWDAAVEKLLKEDPPTPPYGYLIVPRQLSEEEWLAKHPPVEQKQDME